MISIQDHLIPLKTFRTKYYGCDCVGPCLVCNFSLIYSSNLSRSHEHTISDLLFFSTLQLISLFSPSPALVGLSACVLSVVGVRPGEVGKSLLLSRLEQGSTPVTVHIPSALLQVSTELQSVAMPTQHRCTMMKHTKIFVLHRIFFKLW